MRMLLIVLMSSCLAATAAWGCGAGGDAITRVTIEPLASATARPPAPVGGKPATPPGAVAAETPTVAEEPSETATPADVEAVGTAEAEPTATATAAPLAADGSTAPREGRWIEVDVTAFVVRLMDGDALVREIAPVGVGEEVDTGVYASTQTGLFHVHNKIEDLAYDPPYDTYISHWVGYDMERANGFHSFLKDEAGAVVDASTGRVSNGCIRSGDAEAIFAYAEIGMPVWVHW